MIKLKSLCAFAAAALFAVPAVGQNISTVAGSWNIPNISATAVSIGYPYAVALDSAGTLYLNLGSQIYKLSSTGTLTLVAGNGNYGYSGDGGPATNAAFDAEDIAIDSYGNLYIADPNNSVIRKINASTGIISTVAGNGTSGYTGDGGAATKAELNQPLGVAVDSSGNLYIADSANYAIRKVDTSGDISTLELTQGAANGIMVLPLIGFPASLTFDRSGNLYVADIGDNVIDEITPALACSVVAGNGNQGYTGDGSAATSAELNEPFGVAVDSSGNIFIADQNNNVIRKVDANTGNISTVAGTGTAGFTSDSGVATNVELNSPVRVVVDGSGNLYIADGNFAIRKVAAGTNSLSTVAGNDHWSYSGDGGLATSAQIEVPMGSVVDSSGNVYISDADNSVIRKIDALTGKISTFAGNGISGYMGDGSAATGAELGYPENLALDTFGNLYIADAEDNVIRKVNASTGDISTVAGNGTNGYTGDGGSATSAELNGPEGIAVDAAGNLFIADTGNAVVRKIDALSGDISTVAGNGTSDYAGDGGSATNANLFDPEGVALDTSGNLFIADTGNSVIREVLLDASDTTNYGKITTVAGGATSTNTSSALGVSFYAPTGIYVDNAGVLFVSDAEGNQVYKITDSNFAFPATGIISVLAGNGTFGYSGDGGSATSAGLGNPFSITGDSHGNLLISDSEDCLVRSVAGVVTIAQVATPTFSIAAGSYIGDQTIGIADTTANATIYYTTDDTTPTTNSNVYSGPITVSSTETIEAIAIAKGYFNSSVASATYTIIPPNPTPAISTLSPTYIDKGGAAFTLTVNGAGFVSGSTVYWGSSALTTTYVSATQLTASVPATDIAATGITAITVQSPTPGGGTSNSLKFEVDSADGSSYPPMFTTLTATVTAGSSATYPVTLPSSASNVSVTCLNLPTGATCSYLAGTVTIATSSTTPAGTYPITVIFTETITKTVAAWILLPFLLLPLAITRKRSATKRSWTTACLGMAVLMATMIAVGCGGGSSSSSSTTTTQTEQVTSSATVTLAVK
jgi:sugar lactone lactonase YvrE